MNENPLYEICGRAAWQVPRKVGGHEIIIQGQIPDYVVKLSKTYDLPPGVQEGGMLKGGYTVPSNEVENVKMALKNCRKGRYDKIDIGNGSVTYILSFLGSSKVRQTNYLKLFVS